MTRGVLSEASADDASRVVSAVLGAVGVGVAVGLLHGLPVVDGSIGRRDDALGLGFAYVNAQRGVIPTLAGSRPRAQKFVRRAEKGGDAGRGADAQTTQLTPS